MVRFTCIGVSSIVGGRVCFEHTLLPTRFYIAYSWPSNIHALCISSFFSYLLLVGRYYLYFTIMITVKRKIHSAPRCIVFSFPLKNYLFSATNFLHVHYEPSSVLNTFEAEEENKKNRRRTEISGRGSYRRYIHCGVTKYYGCVSTDIGPACLSRQF